MNCTNCGIETQNPKFCTRSCSIKYWNKHKPKRKRKQRFCKYCKSDITYLEGRRTTCYDCDPNSIDWNSITLEEVQSKRSYQVNSRIRTLARKTYKDKLVYCQNCGYDKHVEVCHVKAISSWPKDTLISTINSPKNLLFLCPNCHWELDNNLLTAVAGVEPT